MIIRVMMMIIMKDRDLNQDDDRLPVTETIKTISFLEFHFTGKCISLFSISQQTFLIEKLGSDQLSNKHCTELCEGFEQFFTQFTRQLKAEHFTMHVSMQAIF